MENALNLDTVLLAEDKKHVIILDQTLLPNECKYLTLDKAEDIWEAIYALRVRGAPAIGVAGGYAYYVLANQIDTEDMDEFVEKCTKMMEYINSSRPTAVNLSWALNRMHGVLMAEKDGKTVAEMKVRLMAEANAIREEDIQISRNIGAYGFELLEKLGKGVGIMTHCNAGTLATAETISEEKGYAMKEDAGRGWRRVVASPLPRKIVEIDQIRQLWDKTIVITCGGGGVPVVENPDGTLEGVAAVIDKDHAAELLAEQMDADALMILTEVEKVAIHWGKPNQKDLSHLSLAEAARYAAQGHFAPGSMLPKVQACMAFVRSNPSRKAIITSLDKAIDALNGKTGTVITFA